MNKQKILAIDDDREFLSEIKDILEANHYEVACSSDLDDSLEKAARIRPDVILLDLKLKSISGISIFSDLRSRKETCAIPVIAVTGAYTGTFHEKMMRDYGMEDFIIKPFNPVDLVSKINVLIEKRLISEEMEKVDKIEKELDKNFPDANEYLGI